MCPAADPGCCVALPHTGVVASTNVEEACKGVDIAVMLGGFPRKAGMERKDVMSKNVSIYATQAAALEKHANKGVKVGGLCCSCSSSMAAGAPAHQH